VSVASKIYTQEGDKGSLSVFLSLCKGCGLCMEKCPQKCLSWSNNLGLYGTPTVEADMEKCIACGICKTVCPDCAIVVEKKKK
jgi:2-oxoglutarate ferredoxin oxidoreductase subunit delta